MNPMGYGMDFSVKFVFLLDLDMDP